MRDADLKRTILSAFAPKADASCAKALSNCDATKTKKLLLWLDESGLALYFFHRLQSLNAVDHLPEHFRKALELRAQKNQARAQYMLSEFERLNHSLARHGVKYCAIKGFTLVPDFCPNPFLRHQSDFDFLIAPESVSNVTAAFEACGYKFEGVVPGGEMMFGTPLMHIPSHSDDLYEIPRHRQVDLRTVLWHPRECAFLIAPSDCLNRTQDKTSMGVSFPTLAMDDAFLLQMVHAFHHWLGSWVRLSWLYEINLFLANHERDEELWQAVRVRAGADARLRNALGLLLKLTSQLFSQPLPPFLERWCIAPLPYELGAWVEQFGTNWAISDRPGKKLTLFVHGSFVSDAKSWQKYLLRRIFPLHLRSFKVKLADPGWKARVGAGASRYGNLFRQAIFHARETGSLAINAVRWKRALRAAAKPSMLATK